MPSNPNVLKNYAVPRGLSLEKLIPILRDMNLVIPGVVEGLVREWSIVEGADPIPVKHISVTDHTGTNTLLIPRQSHKDF